MLNARSGGSGFGDFCRNTILSGTKLYALQRARRAEARDGFGQKSPRAQGRSHPQVKQSRWRFVRFAGNIMISTIKEQGDEQRHGP
jgi:hypothetical protein